MYNLKQIRPKNKALNVGTKHDKKNNPLSHYTFTLERKQGVSLNEECTYF